EGLSRFWGVAVRGRARSDRSFAPSVSRRETLLQRLHHVYHWGAVRCLWRRYHRAAFEFGLDQIVEARLKFIPILCRLERCGEAFDELIGQLDFLGLEFYVVLLA